MTPYDVIERSSLPPWMTVAVGELGQAEVPGEQHSPRVLAYHRATTLKATTDEVPWCASFVSWCLGVVGQKHTRSARARSYESWGQPCPVDLLAPGAVVVFWRGKHPGVGTGHVGFYVGGDPASGRVWVLGGNQGDAVTVKAYSTAKVLGYRWPLGPLPSPESGALARGAQAGAAASEHWR